MAFKFDNAHGETAPSAGLKKPRDPSPDDNGGRLLSHINRAWLKTRAKDRLEAVNFYAQVLGHIVGAGQMSAQGANAFMLSLVGNKHSAVIAQRIQMGARSPQRIESLLKVLGIDQPVRSKPPVTSKRRPTTDVPDVSRIEATRLRAMEPDAKELVIQIAIVDLLKERVQPGVYWFSVPNGANTSVRERGKLSASGMRCGVPDLAFVINGRAHFLELKRRVGGSVSPEQRQAHAEIVAAGGVVEIAKGYTAAVDVLTLWKAITQ